MNLNISARRTGKTTKIADDVNWCSLFGMTPICCIFPSQLYLRNFEKLYLAKYNLTVKEREVIHMFKGPCTVSEYCANSVYVFAMIRRINPLRIYLDDIEYYDYRFYSEICSLYNDIIYAYGIHKPIKTKK
jgi:hypothetical protein